jgi:quercetin dioxygenase-like cupin family protein
MVTAGDSIENPVTGETMTFLLTGRETAGELLRIDMNVRPGGFVAGEHVHPHQEERFYVTGGQITLRVDGRECHHVEGEQITIPAGTPHVWWNSGPDDLRVVLEFRPAGRFAEFIETFFALARAGKTNRWGLPKNLLQLAVTFAEYRDVLFATRPPQVVQRLLFAVLDPLGRLLGYRADEPYADLPKPPRERRRVSVRAIGPSRGLPTVAPALVGRQSVRGTH